jgi:hypothetical protein
MNRYFIFLHIEEEWLSQLFDLAIFLINPNEKWPAHITVAGPYTSVKKAPKVRDFEKRVSVLGFGRFKSSSQNTVYMRVGIPDLDEVWDKPDFKSGARIPHITIYDGDDQEISDALYEWGADQRFFFSFHVSKLDVVKSTKNQGTFGLLHRVNPNVLNETRGKDIKRLSSLPENERLQLAMIALKKAKAHAHAHAV